MTNQIPESVHVHLERLCLSDRDEVLAKWESIPTVPDLDKQIYDIISAKPEMLDMLTWHDRPDIAARLQALDIELREQEMRGEIQYGARRDAEAAAETAAHVEILKDPYACGTTHCLAGWAVALSGLPPEEAAKWDQCALGAAVFLKSTGSFPSFYGTNESALKEMKSRSEKGK